LELKKLYSVCAQSEAADTCVSGMINFWSGRHLFRVGYGGILACGLDADWSWYQYQLRLENLPDVPHNGEFTFKLFEQAFCADVEMSKIRIPFFVTTENENKMKATFDGRHEGEKQWKFRGRVGCTKHALSTCIPYCMEPEPKEHANSKLKAKLLNKLIAVENFYNRREDKAKGLIRAIPEKSGTWTWGL